MAKVSDDALLMGQIRKRFTQEERDRIVALRTAGVAVTDIVAEFGGRRRTIYNVLQNPTPGPRKQRALTTEHRDQILALWGAGMAAGRIAKEVGRDRAYVTRILVGAGYQPEARPFKASPGDRVKHGAGYILVHIADDDPCAEMRTENGLVLEHRLVLARELGRPLAATETVHHINGRRDDNRPENLQLRKGNHGAGVFMSCRDCGSHDVVMGPLATSD